MQVSYTGVVLNPESKALLLSQCQPPDGWDVKAHHMTVNLGAASKGLAAGNVGQEVELKVVAVARDGFVQAVKVETTVGSINPVKHVTIAVNRAGGGKPVHSNRLTEWTEITPITLKGVVAECGQGDVVISA
jgi:hypothetical protein